MIILVWDECPYVQFRAACVTSTEFVVGDYKLAREEGAPKYLWFDCSMLLLLDLSVDQSLSLNGALPSLL